MTPCVLLLSVSVQLTPRVTDVPEIPAILVAPTHHLNVMVYICIIGSVNIHAAVVIEHEVIWACNAACDGTPLLNL